MLVLAVFAVALLLVLSVGLTTAVRAELLASRTSLERAQALFLAEAGINQARAILLYEDPNLDTLQDEWGPEAEEPLDSPQPLGSGYYRVRIYDATGRVDVNNADFETLTQLTGDATTAQAILDWRNQGQLTEYYRSLPFPYDPRRGQFQTPGELLLVKGVTPDLYFGAGGQPGLRDLVTVYSPSLDVTSDGARGTDLNFIGSSSYEGDAFYNSLLKQYGTALDIYYLREIARVYSDLSREGRQFTSLGQLADVLTEDALEQSLDFFTINARGGSITWGKVNANTAPEAVLAALPGSSTTLAHALVAERQKQPFTSMGQVAKAILTNGGKHAFERMIGSLNTKSSCFIIDAMGYTETNRRFRRLIALAYRTKYQVAILHQVEEDIPLPPPATGVAANALSRRSRLAPS